MAFRFKTYAVLCLTLAAISVSSCGRDGGDDVSVDIRRLDLDISHGHMPGDSLGERAVKRLFELSGYPEASESSVGEYAMKPSIHSHVGAVEAEFADMEGESAALGRVFSSLERTFPKAEIPEVLTIISPFSQSVIVTDSMLYIGLNHYLGVDYEPYGYFPEYMRHLKVRERIPVDVAEAIIRTSYPYAPSSDYPRVIGRLAYEGAVAMAVMSVTGEDAMNVLGYSPEQYMWLKDNERDVWDALISRQLLFSTDASVVRSLVDVGPHSSVISPDAPGRAGRYMGTSMMQQYVKNNPEVTLEQLLSPEVYESDDLLTKAGYRP